MSYKIVPVCGHFEVYIDGEFYCTADNMKEVEKEIKEYIEHTFGYNLSRTCDEIRPTYKFDESCQGSVPEAIIAFLEGNSFAEIIRLAILLGGDADTQAAIAGSIAEAYYGVPVDCIDEIKKYLTDDIIEVITNFKNFYDEKFPN